MVIKNDIILSRIKNRLNDEYKGILNTPLEKVNDLIEYIKFQMRGIDNHEK